MGIANAEFNVESPGSTVKKSYTIHPGEMVPSATDLEELGVGFLSVYNPIDSEGSVTVISPAYPGRLPGPNNALRLEDPLPPKTVYSRTAYFENTQGETCLFSMKVIHLA